MSEGWPRKAQELHTRFDMKGKREFLKIGSQGALGRSADAPFSFASGIQEDQQTQYWVPSSNGTVAKGRKGQLQV